MTIFDGFATSLGALSERLMRLVTGTIQTQVELSELKIEQSGKMAQWLERRGQILVQVTKVGFEFTMPIRGWYNLMPIVHPHTEQQIQMYGTGKQWVEARNGMVLHCEVI